MAALTTLLPLVLQANETAEFFTISDTDSESEQQQQR